ncbi:MAG: hypothetical protein WBA97_35170 [Actinophytocola sp.]|uniref:hypothetical protein n=1 Tax=Actinophytocola sp. TaxID=1872138 RepID=UPI003C71451F
MIDEPSTHVEEGAGARWVTEVENAMYLEEQDFLSLAAYNAGSVPIGDGEFQATADLTPVVGGPGVRLHLVSYSQAGGPVPVHTLFGFGVANLRRYLSPGEYTIHAWLPAELGGGDVHTRVTI